MSKPRRKTLRLKKPAAPGAAQMAVPLTYPERKLWYHDNHLLRLISLFVGIVSLALTLVLSRDELFLSKEERLAMQREAIRLEIEERYKIEKEKQRQEQLERERQEKIRLEQERLEKERLAKEAEEKQKQLAAEQKVKKPSRKTRKKGQVGRFFKELFS